MPAPARRTLTRRALLRGAAQGAVAAGAASALGGCASAAIPGASGYGGSGGSGPGGRLRVGIVGGSAKDTVDAHRTKTHPDEARAINLYDCLVTYDPDYKHEYALAEEIEPSKDAATWTIRLRDGLEFHNGKSVRAEDVAFTIKRILDPKDPKVGAEDLASIDVDRMKALDKRTLRLHLKHPDAVLLDAFAQYPNGIVPVGYDPKHPVGAGPFKLESFEPGQQSVMTRHENYWRPNQPHLAELTIVDFTDDTARVNALLGAQVDAIDQLPLGLIHVIKAAADLQVLESRTGAWLPFTMRVDRPPFDDVRVRQALRLVVDRERMIKQVLSGHGAIANDLYARYDPCYASDLPQRHQDLEKARSLLRAAGKENLRVKLVTASVAAGLVEAAQVFAQQAKGAGVQVDINKVNPGTFYGDRYLKWGFAQDFWFTRNFLSQAAKGSLPGSPYNETHWSDAEFRRLVAEARQTVDDKRRCELVAEAQKIEYEKGGYIIWGFPDQIDAYNSRLEGFVPHKSGIPLTHYNFRRVRYRT
ncbi:MAG: ABC transporter substrate-binding protein [Streptosporangiales bacterium]